MTVRELEFWTIVTIAILLIAFLGSGCGAGFFSASTTATYTGPDGKQISYTSNKEQQGLDLELHETAGKVDSLKVHVDKASTTEQAILAAAAAQLKMMEIFEKLVPLLEKAAASGK